MDQRRKIQKCILLIVTTQLLCVLTLATIGVVTKATNAERNASEAVKTAKDAAKTAESAAGAVEEVQKSIDGRTVGNKYGNVPYISEEGTTHVGKTIEFHSTDNYPDNDGKLYVENGVLYFCDKTGTVKTVQMV